MTNETIVEAPLAASDTPTPPVGVVEGVVVLTEELRGMVHDHLALVVLETRVFLHALVRMAVTAIITAVLLVSVWLAVVGAGVLALIDIGLAPALAMTVLAMLNLVLALTGCMLIRRAGGKLGLPTTLRALQPRVTSAPGTSRQA